MAKRGTKQPETPLSATASAQHDKDWQDLVAEFKAPLAGYFSKRLADADEVDDLVQDVFLRLIRRGGRTDIDHMRGYIFQVARSVLADRLRRGQARQSHAHHPFNVEEHGGSDISPERVLLGREELAQMLAALKTLPERTQDVFVLRAFENQKYADIARLLSISTRAAEKHMAKALAHVGMALNQDDDTR